MTPHEFNRINKIIEEANKEISLINEDAYITINFKKSNTNINMEQIEYYQGLINFVYQSYDIERNDKSRKGKCAKIRYALYYILKKDYPTTLSFVGLLFNKVHSSVLLTLKDISSHIKMTEKINKIKGYSEADKDDIVYLIHEIRIILNSKNNN